MAGCSFPIWNGPKRPLSWPRGFLPTFLGLCLPVLANHHYHSVSGCKTSNGTPTGTRPTRWIPVWSFRGCARPPRGGDKFASKLARKMRRVESVPNRCAEENLRPYPKLCNKCSTQVMVHGCWGKGPVSHPDFKRLTAEQHTGPGRPRQQEAVVASFFTYHLYNI